MTANEVVNLQAIAGQVQLQNTLNAIQAALPAMQNQLAAMQNQLATMQNQSAAMQNQLTAVGNQFNQFEQMSVLITCFFLLVLTLSRFPIRLHNVSASHTAVLLGPAGPIPANLPNTRDALIKATGER